jgi:hypothetical protein
MLCPDAQPMTLQPGNPSDDPPRPSRAARAAASIGRTLVCWLAAIWMTGLAGGLTPAAAQDDIFGNSYLTPFPDRDVYRIQVIGDWLAEGLLSGLSEGLASDARVQMPRKLQSLNGLIRFESFDTFDETMGRELPHIAVVMLGMGDRVSLRDQKWRRVVVGSDEWKAEYGRRVDRLIKILKKRGASVYWVGLPIVRRLDIANDVQMLNEVYRERALQNSIKFIDVYDAFADENGVFSQYGPDLAGNSRLLRDSDGIGFTAAGYRKLAYFVEREIKRDLAQAKNERNVPLAGSESEQRRLIPRATPAPQSGWDGTVSQAEGGKAPADAARKPQAQNLPAGAGDQKADNTRITLKTIGRAGREEVTTLEILRPAIPASVIALITRRESPDRLSNVGETVTDAIPGGMVVMSSVMPGLGAGSLEHRRRLAPTQSPFYRVLVKGERLPPKPGRADDFRWPREEMVADPDRPAESANPPAPRPVARPSPRQPRVQSSAPGSAAPAQ